MKTPFHSTEISSCLMELGSQYAGLTSHEVKKRQLQYGPNTLPTGEDPHRFLIFISQFNNILVYILLAIVLVSAFFGKYIDAAVIMMVLIVNALVGAIQEIKAAKAVKGLSSFVKQSAKVKRDNQIITIDAIDIVPGDIIILEEGDKIPADGRVLEASNFRTIESSLTGEVYPISKKNDCLDASTVLADRINMVWMSTHVSSGRAEVIVVATGEDTQIGTIAQSLSDIGTQESQFQKSIASLSKVIAIVSTIAALLIAGISYITGHNLLETIMFSIASLVSGIPEGLPAILSLVLAIGARSMSDKKAIVRSLTATETLGCVSIICTDKTGTLTQNAMTVEYLATSPTQCYSITGTGRSTQGEIQLDNKTVSINNHNDLEEIITIASHCNQGMINNLEDGSQQIIGDPTEVALYVLGQKTKITKDTSGLNIIFDLPFNAEKKMRATLVSKQGQQTNTLYVIGAADNIIMDSTTTGNQQKVWLDYIEHFSSQGKRVLGVAKKTLDKSLSNMNPQDLCELDIVGIIVIQDPLRTEVPQAIKDCHNAGIRVIMMTGDHKSTAKSIGFQLGLVNEQYPDVVTEHELQTMSEQEIKKLIQTCNIFARCTPHRKLEILTMLQEQGDIVAMTGDGVNDAPSLKKADVGIAMGIMGTDVAREASNIILADDNFATIVSAVQQGRVIYNNVKKSSLLAVNRVIAGMGSLILILLWGDSIPFVASQLLWLNLVTETITGIGIAFENAEGNEMKQKPRKPNTPMVDSTDIMSLIINSGLMIILVVGIYIWSSKQGYSQILTVTLSFLVLYFAQFANLFNLRSFHKSIFDIGFFSNKAIIYGTLLSIALQGAAIARPWLANILAFTWTGRGLFFLCIGLASLIFICGETYKYYMRRNIVSGI